VFIVHFPIPFPIKLNYTMKVPTVHSLKGLLTIYQIIWHTRIAQRKLFNLNIILVWNAQILMLHKTPTITQILQQSNYWK
jgi:hypothetical protein